MLVRKIEKKSISIKLLSPKFAICSQSRTTFVANQQTLVLVLHISANGALMVMNVMTLFTVDVVEMKIVLTQKLNVKPVV